MEGNFLDKLSKSQKEYINNEDMPLKLRIYELFYHIVKKQKVNVLFTIIVLILETCEIVSFGFIPQFYDIWQVDLKVLDYINKILGAPRIMYLMQFITYNEFIIVKIIFIIVVFIFTILLIFALQVNNPKSKFYRIFLIIFRYYLNIVPIWFLNPFLETLLAVMKCVNKHLMMFPTTECFKGMHYLYYILSIIFCIIFLIELCLMEIFNYCPFENDKNYQKISTHSEFITCIYKLVLIFITFMGLDRTLCAVLSLVGSIIVAKECYSHPTYNSPILETMKNIRNVMVFWTFLVTFLGIIFPNSLFCKGLYFLVFGFPIIIFFGVIIQKISENTELANITNYRNAEDYLKQTKEVINVFNKTFSKSKHNREKKKCDLLLRGYIKVHNENCKYSECPLTNYFELKTENSKVQALLNHINTLFSNGLKKFPSDLKLMINFVNFNYEKKYNLHNANILINKLDNLEKTINEEFLVYIIKKNNSQFKGGNVDNDIDNGSQSNDLTESIDAKFKRLKFLIEESAKLFSDFWGNLATNLTINLNLPKIFYLGKKLNQYLNEINIIWEKELKNKKIDYDNQLIVQLYAYFLRKIMRNKNQSEEITKKLNEDNHFENSHKNNETKIDLENLDKILENQDYLIISRTNDKGECDIIQCSNSIVHLLGYLKQELIGKRIEYIMPTMFSEDNKHMKMMAFRMQKAKSDLINSLGNNIKAAFEKKSNTLTIPKAKTGFIFPMSVKFTFYSEDDFSNSYIISTKLEIKDSKSIYPFYILTKDDFTIEYISSSSMILGLTLELIKTHIIDLNILIRDSKNMPINFYESYNLYEEEPKEVLWIYPDKIYPKDEQSKINEDDLENYIKISEKKRFNLLINKMKYDDSEVIGYCFRLVENKNIKSKEIISENMNIKTDISYNFVYNMQTFNYIRAKIVSEKRTINNEALGLISSPTLDNVSSRKIYAGGSFRKSLECKSSAKQGEENNDDIKSDSDEEIIKVEKVELNKDKINKMQAEGSAEIFRFITTIPWYGKDVSLERFQVNKSRYSVGKTTEPNINISIAEFKKKIEEKIKKLNLEKKNNKSSSGSNKKNYNDSFNKTDESLSSKLKDEKEKESSSDYVDTNGAISKYINQKSARNIIIFSFIVFILSLVFEILEFTFSFVNLQSWRNDMKISRYSYDILKDMIYTKYFITEAVLAQSDPEYKNLNNTDNITYTRDMMSEMSDYRDDITTKYNLLTTKLNYDRHKELKEYIQSTSISLYTFSNNESKIEKITVSRAMERIPTDIFFVSIKSDNSATSIKMTQINTYELMYNLLNDINISFKKINELVLLDVYKLTDKKYVILVIVCLSLVFQIFNLIILHRLLINYINDKEKPLNLFFTVKKQKFEELKENSELFLNQLLNKIVGNDDVEQETVSTNSINLDASDIVITKLKIKNSYHKSSQFKGSTLITYVEMCLFWLIIEVYFFVKFFYFSSAANRLILMAKITNITNFSEIDAIEKCDIMKSFYYNPNISILSRNDTEVVVKEKIDTLTSSLQQFISQSYENNMYKEKYLLGKMIYDISDIVTGGAKDNINLQLVITHGFKSSIIRYYELIYMIYFVRDKYVAMGPMGANEKFNNFELFADINDILRNVIRPWYSSLKKEMSSSFNDYYDNLILVQVSCFICVLVLITIVYIVVWKKYEIKLKESLKTSVELLNLLPLEIKEQIARNITEEEDELDKE